MKFVLVQIEDVRAEFRLEGEGRKDLKVCICASEGPVGILAVTIIKRVVYATGIERVVIGQMGDGIDDRVDRELCDQLAGCREGIVIGDPVQLGAVDCQVEAEGQSV